MDRAKAIELLKLAVPIKALTQQEYSDFVEAVNMGMDALEQPEERTDKRTETHACDLIDRQQAIDEIKKMCDECDSSWCGDCRVGDLDGDVFAILRSLPPAQPEPPWIPVSERLPETEEFVLASMTGKYRNITFEHACEIADYADGEWCVYAYPHMSAEKCTELIEAWMPLPEPYTK